MNDMCADCGHGPRQWHRGVSGSHPEPGLCLRRTPCGEDDEGAKPDPFSPTGWSIPCGCKQWVQPYISQPFGEDGTLLCPVCHKAIEATQFYVEVRQRHHVDEDIRLALHRDCLGGVIT